MDHIRNIQDTIDENREAIPTGVVADVMRECQQAYEALPKLWKVHYIEVYAVKKNSVESVAKTLIVEEDANLMTNSARWFWFKVLDEGRGIVLCWNDEFWKSLGISDNAQPGKRRTPRNFQIQLAY